MNNTLKPCPFCGTEPNHMTSELGDNPCFYYECENPKCCAAEKGWHDTEKEAIDAWNARPHEEALHKEIEQIMLSHEQATNEALKLQKRVHELESVNQALVDKMNAMAMKPNQEVITWHECSEELPTESGHYLILCEDDVICIDWFNNGSDEAGNLEDHCPWGDPEWIIEVQDPGAYKVIAWAYLPKGIKYEN